MKCYIKEFQHQYLFFLTVTILNKIWLFHQEKYVKIVIESLDYIRKNKQKIEYIHNNPVNKGWKLVKNRTNYKYSSVCFYDKRQKPIIEINDIGELF